MRIYYQRVTEDEIMARRRALDEMVRKMPMGTFGDGEIIWDFVYNAEANMFFRGDMCDWLFEYNNHRIELCWDIFAGRRQIRADFFQSGELVMRNFYYIPEISDKEALRLVREAAKQKIDHEIEHQG
jgi:hypothetical protein